MSRATRSKTKKNANVSMSEDQLQALIEGIQSSFSNTSHREERAKQEGTFLKCTASFSNSLQDIDTFVDAIEAYRDCANISEANALKGLSLLLKDEAAIWWTGVKGDIKTWHDALDSLKRAFGHVKPAYAIYRELFATEQDEGMKTEIFIAKTRALLSKLPKPALPAVVQLDMIYGLLNRRIQKRVPRESVENFDQLIHNARLAELTMKNKNAQDKAEKKR